MKFSSVVGYHMNPMTCGVAKFNSELAKRLGVEWVGVEQPHRLGDAPLFSLKWSEIEAEADENHVRLQALGNRPYGVFWHDAGDQIITANATHVFYADPSLGSPGLWCPSLITPRKRPVRLFSFGMAHKLQTEKYRRVRELLDAASLPYHLRVSVGLHEGTSLDGAEKHFDALREIMGPENVTILGILSDDAVSEELANAEYVLAFFEKGLRANNTTVHAASVAGKRIITNCDEQTSAWMRTLGHDINRMTKWPSEPYMFSWEHLISEMEGCVQLKSPIA